MFIAMNRFKIVLGKEQDFESVWKNRDTHLKGVTGFKEFHLVKGNIPLMNFLAYSSFKNLNVDGATTNEKKSIIPKRIAVRYVILCSIIIKQLQIPQN